MGWNTFVYESNARNLSVSKREKQVLTRGWEVLDQIVYAHVSACKNNKIKLKNLNMNFRNK
jgi:hypothetical protein